MPPIKEKVIDKRDNLFHQKQVKAKPTKSERKLRNRVVEFYLPYGYENEGRRQCKK